MFCGMKSHLLEIGNHRKLGHNMSEMVTFSNGTATVMGGEFQEPEVIVIPCDLCNEPLAITPEINDKVFITCLRCHAVNGKPTPQA